MSVMALRRNPYRKCKKEDATILATGTWVNEWGKDRVDKVNHPNRVSVMSLLSQDMFRNGVKDVPTTPPSNVQSVVVLS